MKKKGEVLIENVVFIILNLIFLTILILFLLKQGTGVVLMERAHAKQISLLIDSAKPGMTLKVNLEKLYDISKEKNFPFDETIKIENNIVTVKLDPEGGFSYHYFNDVIANAYPEPDNEGGYTGMYIIKILKK